jgi:hypothetical protein
MPNEINANKYLDAIYIVYYRMSCHDKNIIYSRSLVSSSPAIYMFNRKRERDNSL